MNKTDLLLIAPATPQDWHWAITPQDIDKIKAYDWETVKAVYFANFDKFKRVACSFCNKYDVQLYGVDDCMQQIYVDLPRYDFRNTISLYHSLKHSFAQALGFSKHRTISLETPLFNGDDTTLGDTIAVYDIDEVETQEQEQKVVEMVAEQTQLTDNQRDTLIAAAFGCVVTKGIFDFYAKTFANKY